VQHSTITVADDGIVIQTAIINGRMLHRGNLFSVDLEPT